MVRVQDLMRPFHNGSGNANKVAGQQRFGEAVACVLLPGRDDERGVGRPGADDRSHRMAEPACRMQIDEACAAGCLGIAVCHGDHASLLQAQNIRNFGRVG
jgi:hypothetical protein